MEDRLISRETAILAKEKGFLLKQSKGYYKHGTDTDYVALLLWCESEPQEPEFGYAPTQSLLQKWLREIHKIDIYIIGYGFGYYAQLNNVPPANQGDVKYVDRRWNMPPKEENSGSLRTYEEALEKGLQEALNHIKL